jgi:endonuclease YncB( thermonuclease family)
MAFKLLPATVLILAVVTSPSVSWADFMAKVVTVHEGDRLTIYHNGRSEMIYLKNVDCPEPKQPYGKQARRAAAAYIGGREIVVRGLQQDRQGRRRAEVLLLDGRNVEEELIKEGLAWARPETAGGRRLGEIEELARAERKGLWSEPNPVPPWKWRQKMKAKR